MSGRGKLGGGGTGRGGGRGRGRGKSGMLVGGAGWYIPGRVAGLKPVRRKVGRPPKSAHHVLPMHTTEPADNTGHPGVAPPGGKQAPHRLLAARGDGRAERAPVGAHSHQPPRPHLPPTQAVAAQEHREPHAQAVAQSSRERRGQGSLSGAASISCGAPQPHTQAQPSTQQEDCPGGADKGGPGAELARGSRQLALQPASSPHAGSDSDSEEVDSAGARKQALLYLRRRRKYNQLETLVLDDEGGAVQGAAAGQEQGEAQGAAGADDPDAQVTTGGPGTQVRGPGRVQSSWAGQVEESCSHVVAMWSCCHVVAMYCSCHVVL